MIKRASYTWDRLRLDRDGDDIVQYEPSGYTTRLVKGDYSFPVYRMLLDLVDECAVLGYVNHRLPRITADDAQHPLPLPTRRLPPPVKGHIGEEEIIRLSAELDHTYDVLRKTTEALNVLIESQKKTGDG